MIVKTLTSRLWICWVQCPSLWLYSPSHNQVHCFVDDRFTWCSCSTCNNSMQGVSKDCFQNQVINAESLRGYNLGHLTSFSLMVHLEARIKEGFPGHKLQKQTNLLPNMHYWSYRFISLTLLRLFSEKWTRSKRMSQINCKRRSRTAIVRVDQYPTRLELMFQPTNAVTNTASSTDVLYTIFQAYGRLTPVWSVSYALQEYGLLVDYLPYQFT